MAYLSGRFFYPINTIFIFTNDYNAMRALLIFLCCSLLLVFAGGCTPVKRYDAADDYYWRGVKYLYGRDGVPQNITFANYWLKQAAELNHPAAMYHWGVNSELGIGMRQDYKKAIKWYTHAATAGNKLAQHNLGMLYYQGLGTQKNLELAIYWFSRSALQGHKPSMENIDYIEQEMLSAAQYPTSPVQEKDDVNVFLQQMLAPEKIVTIPAE